MVRQSGNGRRELWWRTTPMDGGVEKRRGQLRSREGAESRFDEDTGTVVSEEPEELAETMARRSWRDAAKTPNASTAIRVVEANDISLRDG
ncbi:hypothetical protein DBV15_02045 [Temnothorax longispinosus]|uniref:Uncharacterized protein n=1 Tax=Temnothorax longispinosus TaxID=300112 RepID=A0A4S2KP50_9HYME|nr:hypothetical protein DBV15_02045 [Temnothorax longispinosus]